MKVSQRGCLAGCLSIPPCRISRRELQFTENSRFLCLLWKVKLGTWGPFPFRRSFGCRCWAKTAPGGGWWKAEASDCLWFRLQRQLWLLCHLGRFNWDESMLGFKPALFLVSFRNWTLLGCRMYTVIHGRCIKSQKYSCYQCFLNNTTKKLREKP